MPATTIALRRSIRRARGDPSMTNQAKSPTTRAAQANNSGRLGIRTSGSGSGTIGIWHNMEDIILGLSRLAEERCLDAWNTRPRQSAKRGQATETCLSRLGEFAFFHDRVSVLAKVAEVDVLLSANDREMGDAAGRQNPACIVDAGRTEPAGGWSGISGVGWGAEVPLNNRSHPQLSAGMAPIDPRPNLTAIGDLSASRNVAQPTNHVLAKIRATRRC